MTVVDAVMLEARAGALAKRSIKTSAKMAGIRLAIECMDLTTLEGKDSEGRVRSLCAKARRPAPHLPDIPSVAAVCVYPNLVSTAKQALTGSSVKVASVATAFPSGQSGIDIKLADTQAAIDAGADEIDMVIDRGAFLAGRYRDVADEIIAVKAVCAGARSGQGVHLKVILETGELGTYDNVRPRQRHRARLRCGLHQNVDREGHDERDISGCGDDVRGNSRLRAPHRPPRRVQNRRRVPHDKTGAHVFGHRQRDARRFMAQSRTCCASGPVHCSTIC